jgi:hypothetical protein
VIWHLKNSPPMEFKGVGSPFISNFLHDRYFRVRLGNDLSAWYPQERVPQESVSSVALFTIAINGIVNAVSLSIFGHPWVVSKHSVISPSPPNNTMDNTY